MKSDNRKALWHSTDSTIKKTMIKQIFKNKTDTHVQLAREFLQFIRLDDKANLRDIHAHYANLLCITLARSHDPQYIEDIMMTKMCGDLFFYIDSNLLFEFSPNHSRETCIGDTIRYVNDINNLDNSKPWFAIYKKWINHYANQYDESLVIKSWNRYKENDYCDSY